MLLALLKQQQQQQYTVTISPSYHPFAEGWSLLCHQAITQPRHYYTVTVVSGCEVGVSNGSEVTICGT